MNQNYTYSASFPEIIRSFLNNRKLIFQMSKRDVLARYRGSFLGLAWSLLNPLLMLAVYTFFFSVVFKSRWGLSQDSGHDDFAVVFFVGLIVHGLFGECINRAPGLITGNSSYVKKVVFPLDVFPWIALISALFHTSISLILLLTLQLLITGTLPWTVVLFPVVIIPLIFFTLGFSWFLAATAVYVRDIAQMTGMFISVLLFISPVFYPISALPKQWVGLIMLNPLTLIIEESRKVLLWGEMPAWQPLGIDCLVSVFVAWLGFCWFQKIRVGFADVM